MRKPPPGYVEAMNARHRLAIGRLKALLAASEKRNIPPDTEEEIRHIAELLGRRDRAAVMLALLTPRQNEILNLVLLGVPSKNIAFDLHISQRTVENHRAAIMHKTQTHCISALARVSFDAEFKNPRAA